MARGAGARLLLDCCQSFPHMPLDVQALGADWIVASAHKACGPTGGTYRHCAAYCSCICCLLPLPLLPAAPASAAYCSYLRCLFKVSASYGPHLTC